MNVNYEYYRTFYYAVKYGSLTKAANILFSNQPNVTRSMNRLEQELGCRLLLRTSHGIQLTPEGERLYRHVQTAVEQLQAGEAELGSNALLQSGSISIGATETALHLLLLEQLREFHRLYPGIHLRISNHSTLHAISALRQGSVDLAVVATPTSIEKPLQETLLMPMHEILIGGDAFSFLCQKPLRYTDLTHYPLIMLEKGTANYQFYNQLFLQHGAVLHADTEAATADQLLPLVKCNLGLSFVPAAFAADAISKGEVFEIPLAEELPARHIALVQDKRKPLGIAGETFVRMLLEKA